MADGKWEMAKAGAFFHLRFAIYHQAALFSAAC
jgi:hypothetical protein